jgi:hypothetical protein
MTIYRGPGGGGNATTDAEINTLTLLTNRSEVASDLAVTAASSASASASEADLSEAAALTSATAAALSEAGATTQAANAAISASDALTSEQAAAISAGNALADAADALASETAAALSASGAATSESNAAASASSASTGASTATTQASNAATSASAASTSATTASTQASNASASASAAASSASSASTSAAESLGYLQAYRATSYGALASDPTQDPNGGAPTVGDEYFNTTANLIKRFNGPTWQASDISTANLAAPTGSSLVGYIPAGTGAVATTVQGKLRESVSVKDFIPVGTLTDNTDCSTWIQAALDTGKSVEFPLGSYLISTTLTLTTPGQMLMGTGGTLVRASGAMETKYLINASSISDITFTGLKFAVATGTAAAQTGGFVHLSFCNFARVLDCVFNAARPGATTNKESTFSLVYTPSCNNLLIQGNQFLYGLGNACGANNSVGSGENGVSVSIVGNLFYNMADTGVGMWTNAHDISVTGNIFNRDDYSTAYNGVHIDVAGAQSVAITGNSFTGNSVGVRLLTNLGYTDKLVSISGNTFQNQFASSTEPATGIKVTSYDNAAGGGDAHFNLLITNNTFKVVTWGINLAPTINPTDTNALTLKIDSNLFDLSAAGAKGVFFNSSTAYGFIKFSPSKNVFVGAGAGADASAGVLPGTKRINGGLEELAFQRSDFQFTGTTAKVLGSFYCGRGLYAMTAAFGTCTDAAGVGGVLSVGLMGGANLLPNNYPIISSTRSNTAFDGFWFYAVTEGTHQLTFTPHPGGHTHNYWYLNFVRLI